MSLSVHEWNVKLAIAYKEYKKDPVRLREEFMIFYRWCMTNAFAAIDTYSRRREQ